MIAKLIAPIRSRLNFRRHPVVRQYLPALLIAAVLFYALARLDARWLPASVVPHFGILLALTLAFGVLTAWLFECRVFQNHSVLRRSFIVPALTLWGIVLFAWISPHIGWSNSKPAYQWVYWPTLGLLMLPWFFWQAVKAVAAVPQLRFAPYIFDSLRDVLAAKNFAENENIGIRWVFTKDFIEVNESGRHNFHTFTPKDVHEMELGLLFKSTLSLHNITEYPQRPVSFQSREGFAGWEFYEYPYWFWPQRKRYLDPNKSVRKNRIRFPRVPEEVRARSAVKLVPKFRAATIYVTRSIPTT